MITVLNAHSPRWATAAHDAILLTVEFAHCGEVPFLAVPADVEPHGRQLYTDATEGRFGEVAPYVIPPEFENVAHHKRETLMARAIERSRHYEMLDMGETVRQWKDYYKTLHALAAAPSWPVVDKWPEAPGE